MNLFPTQHVVSVDEIFQNFVECVSTVKIAIGIGRPIVQHVSLGAGGCGLFRQLMVQILLGPKFLNLWFSRNGIRSLRKGCFWEENGRSKGILFFLFGWSS